MRLTTGLLLLGLFLPAWAVAQDEPPAESESVAIAEVPFGIGERALRLRRVARFVCSGFLLGSLSMDCGGWG